MSQVSKEAVKARMRGALSGAEKRSEEKATTAAQPLFNPTAVTGKTDASGKKVEYEQIIGEKHPNGPYYFTVHSPKDWNENIRQLIPTIDPTHVFDHDYTLSVLMGIEFDKPVFAYGPPGSGKSVTPEQVCARLNYPFMFVAGMGGTEPSDYVGSPWVSEGSMEWKDGPMSFAVRHGAYLLYDEPFKASAQTNMCIQSLMDSRRTLKLYGHPDPIEGNLKANPTFRICLADNVRGAGDQMDRYAAEIQDQSTLNRAVYKLQVKYLPQPRECEILANKFPDSTAKLRAKIVMMATKLRNGWDKGDIEMPFSVRDTQEWLEAAMFHGDVAEGFKQTYFNSVREDQERKAIMDLWKTVGFDGTYLN